MDALIYKMDLGITRDVLWDAWTTPGGLAAWLCAEARIEPTVGQPLELRWPGNGELPSRVEGEVLSVFRPRHFAFTWSAGRGPVTEVLVDLFPTLDGARLELTHRGWPDEGEAELRAAHHRLWQQALERLRVLLRASEATR